MDLQVNWHQPIALRDGQDEDLIYTCDLESIPDAPGVYVFGRTHGDTMEPLYIGQARNLRGRIRQHFERSTRLMLRIREQAKNGMRVVLVGEWLSNKGQQIERVLPTIERALIKFALAEGYELFNEKGTKTPVHTLSMTGSRVAQKLFRHTMKIEQK